MGRQRATTPASPPPPAQPVAATDVSKMDAVREAVQALGSEANSETVGHYLSQSRNLSHDLPR